MTPEKIALWPEMGLRLVGRYMLIAHTRETPGSEGWNGLLEATRRWIESPGGSAIVSTEGGAPNAVQRAQLTALFGAAKPRVAVITPSTLARAAGVALSWINPNLAIFGPSDIDRALDHAGVSSSERATVRTALDELVRALADRPPPSRAR